MVLFCLWFKFRYLGRFAKAGKEQHSVMFLSKSAWLSLSGSEFFLDDYTLPYSMLGL